MKIHRILLKLSGEVLSGSDEFGIDQKSLQFYTKEIKDACLKNIQTGIVIGGGNIFRGAELQKNGFLDPLRADQMGMLATVINGIALQTSLTASGIKSKLITATQIDKVGEIFNQEKVEEWFEQGYVLVFTGGTGNPLFTTDSAAALRAIEIKADVLLKGTKVDGVYSSDPVKFTDAIRYNQISFKEVIDKRLKVMDLTAFALCMENNLPILVFDINTPGNLVKVLNDFSIGTLIS